MCEHIHVCLICNFLSKCESRLTAFLTRVHVCVCVCLKDSIKWFLNSLLLLHYMHYTHAHPNIQELYRCDSTRMCV